MLSQASFFVTPLSLVSPVAPKCAICKDTGEIDSPGSFLDALPCSCQDALSLLRDVGSVFLANKMTVTMMPAEEDTLWPDDVHISYYGEGY